MVKGNLLVFIFLVQITCIVIGQEFKCPFTEYLHGCKCYPRSKSIVCEDKSGPPKLNVTESPGIQNLSKLELIGTNTSTLDLTSINIETLVLKNIETFKPTVSPLNLQISGIDININITDLFEDSVEMKGTLTINVTKLKSIDKQTFNKIDGTKEIIIRPGLETIGPDTFSKFKDLTYLDLSHNNIKSLGVKAFETNFAENQTIFIDLGYNKLTDDILPNIFKSKAKLTINLANNDIKDLKEDIFKDVLNSSISVYLINNPINCVKLEWIFDQVNAYKAKLNQVQCKNYGNSDLFSLEDKLKRKTTTEQTTHPTTAVSTVNDTTLATTVTTNGTDITTNKTTTEQTITTKAKTMASFWNWFKFNF